jgi:uncharacterized protein (DUF885 family)
MMHHTLFTIMLLLIAANLALASAAFAAPDPAAELHKLFDERHEWNMREFPEWAMARGDYRYADRITDNSYDAIQRRHRETIDFLNRLHAIDRGALDEDDLINYELFELGLERDIRGHEHRAFLAPISGRSGPHQRIAQMAERVRFQSVEDYENYLTRLEQVPQQLENTIELMRKGLDEGRTPPRIVLEGVPMHFRCAARRRRAEHAALAVHALSPPHQ